jgi:tetratricopeptide (TPR) repeat protein
VISAFVGIPLHQPALGQQPGEKLGEVHLPGMWDDAIRSNLAAEAAANEYAAKNYPDATDPAVPHLLDFRIRAYLQLGKDADAKKVVEQAASINKLAAVRLATDTALAAIPARYALDRGRWEEAMRLPVRESQYPAAQSVTYFARALSGARGGYPRDARNALARLDEIEAKLTTAKDEYWAGQTRIQALAASAWLAFLEGKRDEAIASMRQAADLDDASEKNAAMENKLIPIRALLGELYLTARMYNEALTEFEALLKTSPNRFRTIAGAAAAARGAGSVDAAKRYYRALTGLAVDSDGARPEIAEAKTYLSQN